MATKTESIKALLVAKTHDDLSNLYHSGMEVQLNVAQGSGRVVEDTYKGKKWRGYTDDLQTWKAIRIPYNANSDPSFNDTKMTFDIGEHAEGIGMTGWNWKERKSMWVAYDFDSIINHADGLQHDELTLIEESVKDIEWITVRKSTSGTGFHLYVFLEGVPTDNHTEHAALSRAILGKLSGLVGHDLEAKVDVCGGNMWVWHRKMKGTDGLTLVKQGSTLPIESVPPNWQQHLDVIKRKTRTARVKGMSDTSLDDLSNQRSKEMITDEHLRLIQYFEDSKVFYIWDSDRCMLVTHTCLLAQAHKDLEIRGVFKTVSKGTDTNEQNCYCFPEGNGSWAVRRFTRGITEDKIWDQDGQGWTRCYFNREPDLRVAANMYGGTEDKRGNFVFREAEVATEAMQQLGVSLEIPSAWQRKQVTIGRHPKDDSRITVELPCEQHDESSPGWHKEKKTWYKALQYKGQQRVERETEISDFDNLVRHLVTPDRIDCGWAMFSDGAWSTEPLTHITKALKSLNYKANEAEKILGSAVLKPWKRVTKPLQAEYPGGREWNRDAAQLAFVPSINLDNLNHPTWDKLLQHCGKGLDAAIQNDPWAQVNGLQSGSDYLKCWVAALLQFPTEPLPYLFFYGEQNVGKSVFHEALSEILTRGVKRADNAIMSQGNFNAELEDAIVCVIEETDLRKEQSAYNKIKDWVTSRQILIHKKGMTPYQTQNTSHWIHCSNDHQAIQPFPGDTRIVYCYVDVLNPVERVPKSEFINLLRKEAPDFLGSVINLELPPSSDRLRLPIIETADKMLASEGNMNPCLRFISERCHHVKGSKVLYSELFKKFQEYLTDPSEIGEWSQPRFGRALPPQHPRGRVRGSDSSWQVGNLAFKPAEEGAEEKKPLVAIKEGKGTYLVEER